jgi:hypothetical protein
MIVWIVRVQRSSVTQGRGWSVVERAFGACGTDSNTVWMAWTTGIIHLLRDGRSIVDIDRIGRSRRCITRAHTDLYVEIPFLPWASKLPA